MHFSASTAAEYQSTWADEFPERRGGAVKRMRTWHDARPCQNGGYPKHS